VPNADVRKPFGYKLLLKKLRSHKRKTVLLEDSTIFAVG